MYYHKNHKQRQKTKLIYNTSLILGCLVLILTWPLSFVLPPSISFENGIIENLQVIILIFSGIYNLILAFESPNEEAKSFTIWCSALSIFLACRELSWGRVFYQIGMEKHGPVFVDMSDYVWRTEAHIFIVIYILALLVFMLLKLPLLKMFRHRQPFLIMFLMIIAVIFAYIGEHGWLIGKMQGQIVEEFSELAFYLLIPSLCIHHYHEISNYN